MAKKSHKSIDMTSEEDGVEVIEAEGRARTEVAGQVLEEVEGESHEFDELEMDDSDSDAFEELDAEFDSLDDDDELDVDKDELDVDEDDELDDYAVDTVRDEVGVAAAEPIEAEEGVGVAKSNDLDDDAFIEDDASGWLADPDNAEQERFWDGTEWTDQVRPVEEQDFRGRQHLPDHVPELQRALAAATADIDDVEARLSTLFERGKRGGAAPTAAAPAAVTGPPIHEEFGGTDRRDASSGEGAYPMNMGEEGAGEASGGDDEATFAELDAALVAETPEKPDRRFFKRRS
jgi:hypothetical protein